jgi:uncharacterized protein YcbX
MQVASVTVYPVKSARGAPLPTARVELAGLRHDRRWMVVDAEGEPVTARTHRLMYRITAGPHDDGSITLSAADDPALPALFVRTPTKGPAVNVQLSRLPTAVGAGLTADQWLSGVLGTDVRLVWLDDPARRSVGETHGGLPGDTLSLADAGPLLLATTASLRQLTDWIATDPDPGSADQTMSLRRFRPNVVVEGTELEPFIEDSWRRVLIGEVEYRFGECCDRCVMTTLDPDTLEGGKEPIRTLSKHRRWEGKVWFGVRLIPLRTGQLTVGDPVVPLAT